MMFFDSASRLQRPYGAREKSAVAILSVVKRFVADMAVPRAFRTDNGTEYSNSMFVDFCHGLGSRREFTAPYTPQQNGPVESAISRAFKAEHAARLDVPQLYLEIRLEEIRGCTDAAGEGSTIGKGWDTMTSSPGRSPKQPLPGIGLHDALCGRQACPEFIAFDQGVGQICPR